MVITKIFGSRDGETGFTGTRFQRKPRYPASGPQGQRVHHGFRPDGLQNGYRIVFHTAEQRNKKPAVTGLWRRE